MSEEQEPVDIGYVRMAQALLHEWGQLYDLKALAPQVRDRNRACTPTIEDQIIDAQYIVMAEAHGPPM